MVFLLIPWGVAVWATVIAGFLAQWQAAVISGFFVALFTLCLALAIKPRRRGPWG